MVEYSRTFFTKWNVPNCIGAWDGKHISLQAPINSSTEYFNYKSFHSIVLMACVDANYKFIWANVGAQGKISDGGVFWDTKFNNMMSNNLLNLPYECPLPGRVKPIPFVFLADNAYFPLGKNMTKPYPGLNQKGYTIID